MWEAFQDGEKLGTGENLAPWHPIKPGGVLILGQEQVGTLMDAAKEAAHPNTLASPSLLLPKVSVSQTLPLCP